MELQPRAIKVSGDPVPDIPLQSQFSPLLPKRDAPSWAGWGSLLGQAVTGQCRWRRRGIKAVSHGTAQASCPTVVPALLPFRVISPNFVVTCLGPLAQVCSSSDNWSSKSLSKFTLKEMGNLFHHLLVKEVVGARDPLQLL